MQVLPNCYLWVEKATGKRHKVLKLPPSTNGVSVKPCCMCFLLCLLTYIAAELLIVLHTMCPL